MSRIARKRVYVSPAERAAKQFSDALAVFQQAAEGVSKAASILQNDIADTETSIAHLKQKVVDNRATLAQIEGVAANLAKITVPQ